MNKQFRFVLPALILLLSIPAYAISIHSRLPGNIFVAGEPMQLTVTDAKESIRYELTDYYGHRITEGEASAQDGRTTIKLDGQRPGWYELNCTAGNESAKAAIAVVIDRKGAPLPENGRICSDAASVWLLPDQKKLRTFARIVRLAGIPWVRERFSWGVETERGKYDWGRYQNMADAFAAEGVRVSITWHDSPQWLHPTRPDDAYPDDLRDLYQFTKTVSAHFGPKIGAWEVWNEPDIGFWQHLGDRFAGMQKVAYLGLKDGNPQALVLNGSICTGVTPFVRNVYESGIGDYYDIFNWHIYAQPQYYAKQMSDHLALLNDYGVNKRPAWLTECGIRLLGTDGDGKRLLSVENQKNQCRFVPRSAASALAAGTDRYFFFVLPDYLENGVQFGALQPDMTAYPSFVAISAAANILGLSSYMGDYKPAAPAVVRAFRTPRGNVLIAWADKDTGITLPTDRQSISVADIFGNERPVAASHGKVTVKIGTDAIYLIDVGAAIEKQLVGKVRPAGRLPKLSPSRVIVSSYCNLAVDKQHNCYKVYAPGQGRSDSAFNYTVEVYNFNEQSSASGSVEVKAPADWRIESPKRAVTITPMGREVLSFKVMPGKSILSLDDAVIRVQPSFRHERVQPSVSYFRIDPSALTPVQSKPVEWTDSKKWTPQCSENGTVAVTNASPDTLRFDISFNKDGDRWAYPELTWKTPVDMSGYDGIAFDLETFKEDSDPTIRMMLVEDEGDSHPHYINGTHCYGDKRRIVFLFREMAWLGIMGPDPNHHLDLNKIIGIKLGCNTTRDKLLFEAGHFALVKFTGDKRSVK